MLVLLTVALAGWSAAGLVACGPKSMKARIADGERLSDRAGTAMDEAERALAAEDPGRAEERLAEAERALADPDVMTNPESDLLKSRLAELKPRPAELRKELERRELEKKVAARREVVARAVTAFRKALASASGRPERAPVQAAREAARKVRDEVEWDKDLPAREPELKAYLDGIRQDLEAGEKELQLAERTIELVEGPVRDHDEALGRVQRGKAEKKLEERLSLYSEAQDRYRRCAEAADRMLGQWPELQKASLTAGGKPATLAGLVKQCKAQVEGTGKLVAATRKAAEAAAKKAAAAEARKNKGKGQGKGKETGATR
jgi:hypothetical protein